MAEVTLDGERLGIEIRPYKPACSREFLEVSSCDVIDFMACGTL
jgi:hypothetical protein